MSTTEKAQYQLAQGERGKYILGGMKDKFLELCPTHTNQDMALLFGCSATTIFRLRARSGITQRDGQAIRRKASMKRKETLAQSGYVRRPSEAFLKSRKFFSAENNPLKRIKETDPERYAAIRRRMTATRKENRLAERRRMLYGLPRKTKMNIVLQPVSQAAYKQKYDMIKCCNYFAEPDHTTWVCYDNQTRRSTRREATAIKHGLRIVQADEN